MINHAQDAPFAQLFQIADWHAISEKNQDIERGSFRHGILCDICEYLDTEDVVDFSSVNRSVHKYLSMRSPTSGRHPILVNESLSPIERAFYQHQTNFTHNSVKSEQRKASRMMRRYLPLTTQDTFTPQRQQLRDQYRQMRGQLAEINAHMAFLEINAYLSDQEKTQECRQLRTKFRDLRQQSIQLEHAVSALMDQLMDGREPRLELQSDFFKGRRQRRR